MMDLDSAICERQVSEHKAKIREFKNALQLKKEVVDLE